MAKEAQAPKREEVTIKFGKGLAEPFQSKDGREIHANHDPEPGSVRQDAMGQLRAAGQGSPRKPVRQRPVGKDPGGGNYRSDEAGPERPG